MHPNTYFTLWKNVGAILAAFSLAASIPQALAFGEAQKYLIVSSPTTSRLAYLKLPSNGAPATGTEPMRLLLDKGLSVPQGIAIDNYRKRVYVADPDLNKLVAYDIQHSGDALVLGKQITIAAGVEVRWVSIDGLGNVYFTDEGTNRILKVPAKNIEDGTQQTTVLYDGANVSAVSSPGGVASDNYFVYWVNKASGDQAGTLVRALGMPGVSIQGVAGVLPLASNVVKSYGVCLGSNNIFYTDEQAAMYAIPRQGGAPQTVSSSLAQPRGCAFDGSNTIYVADKMHNAVYGFASNAKDFTVQSPTLVKAADLQGAFGIGLYTKLMP